MDIVPVSVGVASRAWDQQQVDLASAAELVAAAPTGGFTTAVAGSAARFLADWQRFTAALGTHAEEQADGLRATIATYLETEALVQNSFALQAYTREYR
jgi:hypothetical protein